MSDWDAHVERLLDRAADDIVREMMRKDAERLGAGWAKVGPDGVAKHVPAKQIAKLKEAK